MTTELENMWSGTCDKGEEIKLKISLNEKFNLGGIIIWNYNEDTYTGVSFILILIIVSFLYHISLISNLILLFDNLIPILSFSYC